VNSVRHETSRTLSNEEREYRRHEPSTNLVKDKNGDIFANSHNISNRWKDFRQVLNVRGVTVKFPQ
jgi:hypothetical protein